MTPERTYLDPNKRFYSNGSSTFFNFGKFKNRRCTWHKNYLKWMLSEESKFTEETRLVAQDILDNPAEHNVFTGFGERIAYVRIQRKKLGAK